MGGAPGVAHGHGLGDFGAGDQDRVALDLGVGPMKDLVLAGQGKAVQLFGVTIGQSLADVRELDAHGVANDLVRAVGRTVDRDLPAVGRAEGHTRGARAVARLVDGVRVGAQVAAGNHGRVGMLHDADVQFAEQAAGRGGHGGRQGFELVGLAGDRIAIVPGAPAAAGLLHVEEGEVALAPILAPTADQGAHERELIDADDGRARLALVPEHAADGVGDEGADVSLVEAADLAAQALAWIARFGRLARLARAVLFGLGHGFLPGGEVLDVLLPGLLERIGLGEFGGHLLAALVGLVGHWADPIAGGSSAYRADHQADRHIHFFVQDDPKGKQQGGEARVVLGRGLFPTFGAAFEQADLGIAERGGLGEQGIVLLVAAHQSGHVRLAGAEPDFAYQDVLEDAGVSSLDDQLFRAAGGERSELDQPLALGVGLGGVGLAAELDGHAFAGRGLAPDGHRHVAL